MGLRGRTRHRHQGESCFTTSNDSTNGRKVAFKTQPTIDSPRLMGVRVQRGKLRKPLLSVKRRTGSIKTYYMLSPAWRMGSIYSLDE